MHACAQRECSAPQDGEEPEGPRVVHELSMGTWIAKGAVSTMPLVMPPPAERRGVCRCDSCRATRLADTPPHFLR